MMYCVNCEFPVSRDEVDNRKCKNCGNDPAHEAPKVSAPQKGMTFENTVKRHKATEWLMQNDPAFRAMMDTSMLSVFNAVWVAMEQGDYIRSRVEEIAKQIIVTEQERKEGYPLPDRK